MNTLVVEQRSPFKWLMIFAILVPTCLIVGVGAGSGLIAGAALTGALASVLTLVLFPLSMSVKLLSLFVALIVAQLLLGSFKIEAVRGASAGNVVILFLLMNWAVVAQQRGKLIRRTPFDICMPLALLVIPGIGILYTSAFRDVQGYSMMSNVLYLKNVFAAFFGFYMVLQLIDTRRELIRFFFILTALFMAAILTGLPASLAHLGSFTEWREGRTAGLLADAINIYAIMLNEVAPFILLLIFLVYRHRPLVQLALMGFMGCLVVSLLTTFSRAGLLGFALGTALTFYINRRGAGRIPIFLPLLLGLTMASLAGSYAPRMADQLVARFDPSTWTNPGDRKSYSEEQRLNKFSGDRLNLWTSCVMLWRENPIFGVGYRVVPIRMSEYHPKQWDNAPHSFYLGPLAEGGLVWLGAILYFFGVLFRVVFKGWKNCLARSDLLGQALCGGACVSLICTAWNGLTLDTLSTSARMYIVCFFWGVAAKYALEYSTGALKDDGPVPSQEEEQPALLTV